MINYAKIIAIYDGNRYESIELNVDTDKDNRELVTLISENGTSKLTMFKMPLTETKFIIFSREQLDKCLFEIELYEKKETKPNKNIEMIKS